MYQHLYTGIFLVHTVTGTAPVTEMANLASECDNNIKNMEESYIVLQVHAKLDADLLSPNLLIHECSNQIPKHVKKLEHHGISVYNIHREIKS